MRAREQAPACTPVWVDRIALGYVVRVRVYLLVRVGTYFLITTRV